MENNTLKEISYALKRIEEENYGRCESCGKMISEVRLEIIPYTRYCIDCQNKKDTGTKTK